jgi:hypothetical protein
MEPENMKLALGVAPAVEVNEFERTKKLKNIVPLIKE